MKITGFNTYLGEFSILVDGKCFYTNNNIYKKYKEGVMHLYHAWEVDITYNIFLKIQAKESFKKINDQ